MVEMSIYGVSFDLVGKQPIVLLKTAEGNKYLPIWIGHPEAAAILMKLQGATAPRPLTHDLLVNMLNELEVEVVRVTVTELRDNTFHASITVIQNGAELEIDSRSSDAIAVAVRAQAPIFAADEVIEESAIEFEGEDVNEEDIVDEFKKFLDHVSAEDFAEAEAEAEVDEDEDVAGAAELSARRRAASARLLNARVDEHPRVDAVDPRAQPGEREAEEDQHR